METNEQRAETTENLSALTSTCGTTNTTPTADAVPSSSSDANTGDVEEATGSKSMEETISSTSDEVDNISLQMNATSSTLNSDKAEKMDLDKEDDLFANDLNLSMMSEGKITENVEDIVSDLENLLGNSVEDYKAMGIESAAKNTKEHKTPAFVQEEDSELNLNVPQVGKTLDNENENAEAFDLKLEDTTKEVVNSDESVKHIDKSDISMKLPNFQETEVEKGIEVKETTAETKENQEQSLTSQQNELETTTCEIEEDKEDTSNVESTNQEQTSLDGKGTSENETVEIADTAPTEKHENVDSESQTKEITEDIQMHVDQPVEPTQSETNETLQSSISETGVNQSESSENEKTHITSTEVLDQSEVTEQDDTPMSIETPESSEIIKETLSIETTPLVSSEIINKEDNQVISEPETKADVLPVEDSVADLQESHKDLSEVVDIPLQVGEAVELHAKPITDIADIDLPKTSQVEEISDKQKEHIVDDTETSEKVCSFEEVDNSQDASKENNETPMDVDDLSAPVIPEDVHKENLDEPEIIPEIVSVLQEIEKVDNPEIVSKVGNVLPEIEKLDEAEIVSVSNVLPEIEKKNEAEVIAETENALPQTEKVDETEVISETEHTSPETEKMDEPEIDHEAELVRAAIEASAFNHFPKEEDKPQETPPPKISDDDVIRAAMDCTARDCNDEEDLIKAAQDCQEREIQEVHEEVTETRKVELQVTSTTCAEDIVEQVDEEVEEVKLKEVKKMEASPSEEDIQPVQDYQKPLNILVDSSVKDTEPSRIPDTRIQEDSNKESSDDDKDKQEEYSSKISQSQELKLTIRRDKTKAEESILKIYNPMDEVVEISPSESETDQETESPIPKLVIKQSQVSPKRKDLSSPYKITIKPIPAKQEEVGIIERSAQKSSPKLIIKPIVKPDEELHHSPKITIKPIPKPEELERCNSPKITIKPLIKPEACVSPKIKIKPIVKPDEEMHTSAHSYEDDRIVLKISKRERDGTPKRDSTPKRESARCSTPKLEEKDEKLGKIKMKFSMSGGGHAHIVNENDSEMEVETKRSRLSDSSYNESIDSSFITSPEVIPVEKPITPTPKRRGRPRKVPLQVRIEDEEPVVVETGLDVDESSGAGDVTEVVPELEPAKRVGRPKRSCRGPSTVRESLGLKPLGEQRGRGGRGSRRPRGRGAGRGRGRGGRGRGRGARAAEAEREEIAEANVKLKEALLDTSFEDVEDVEMKTEEAPQDQISITQDDDSDVMIYEEDTRMSADDLPPSPAKQVVNPIVGELIEESQSSVLSTATTESAKIKKSKMEIEPEGAVISADQLAEYYWGGGGPYMLQEQVAQFLGIKSFKRKYPGIQRRQVDMQERDFIRESGLASEHMCDLGLTVVNSADILDLMYSDFQHKYEEYCKHQRDRQTKDIANKQKALSLAASQEKNKLDIMQQAVESAAQWNASFNKQRREDRKACMDLQTFTINYPKGRMKKLDRPKIGHYPLALVPGQYTDYYKTYTPTELNNLPLNTMLYNPINILEDESQSSGSESDSSSSSSDSSDSESSEDDCNACSSPPSAPANRRVYS